jgi:hypothetical protein
MDKKSALQNFLVFGNFSGTLPEMAAMVKKVAEHAEKTLGEYLLESEGERIEPVLKLAESEKSTATREEILREMIYISQRSVSLTFVSGTAVSASGPGIPPEAGQGARAVVWHSSLRLALVYFNGRFVYGIKNPSDQFWERWQRTHHFPDRRQDLSSYGEPYRVEPWDAE